MPDIETLITLEQAIRKALTDGDTNAANAALEELQMASQEFATAVQLNLPIVVMIVNNGMYGSIRMHQELNFPNRPSGTDLLNPDFAALARCYGAYGETIERHEDFPDAFARAFEAGRPAIIELQVNRMQLTPDRAL